MENSKVPRRTSDSNANGDSRIASKKLRALETALKITQREIEGIVGLRNLVRKEKDEEKRKNLSAIEKVWEQTVFKRLEFGACCEPGRYEISLDYGYEDKEPSLDAGYYLAPQRTLLNYDWNSAQAFLPEDDLDTCLTPM